MFLPSDMLCLVQGFQQSQQQQPQQDKQKKSRRLPFIRRKKSSSTDADGKDENQLLRPTISRGSSSPLPHHEKGGLKQLSGSAPSITCAPQEPTTLTPTTCRSRQKKFLRHFNVDPEEKVIDYYSCALVADILLQGHLYISKNYFAFYSNVFGYVTKLLIPLRSVVNVTKEKTAFILPNAVGVSTTDDRHVFSSLLSRDTTFRLMVQVWQNHAHITPSPQFIATAEEEEKLDRTLLLREETLSESIYQVKKSLPEASVQQTNQESHTECLPASQLMEKCNGVASLPRSTVLLTCATALLIALFISASVLIYRVSTLHHNIDLHHTQRSRALLEVHEYLDTNLNHIYKVRQSLEVLSLLLENERGVKISNEELSHQFVDREINNVRKGEADSRQSHQDISR